MNATNVDEEEYDDDLEGEEDPFEDGIYKVETNRVTVSELGSALFKKSGLIKLQKVDQTSFLSHRLKAENSWRLKAAARNKRRAKRYRKHIKNNRIYQNISQTISHILFAMLTLCLQPCQNIWNTFSQITNTVKIVATAFRRCHIRSITSWACWTQTIKIVNTAFRRYSLNSTIPWACCINTIHCRMVDSTDSELSSNNF